MKLFLTSAGISNQKLADAFVDLIGLSKDEIKVVFIPTASNVEEGDKSWLIDDYSNLKELGLGSIDIVDISAISEKIWKPRLDHANVLFLGGGNTFHLMRWIKESGLERQLPKLLETRVYAGISAGSCIAGPTIYNSVQNLFGEQYDLKIEKGLGLVDFQFIPHLNSQFFTKITKENLEVASKDLKEPVYALDDNSAIIINDDNIEIVSTGKWLRFN